MMKIFSTALLFLLSPTASQTQDRFTAHSSSSTTILAEQYLSALSYLSPLTVNSDVPVTLQKYSDTSTSFLIGQEPVPSNYGMVVVTSDCTTEETSVVPQITVVDSGDEISVVVGVSEQEGANMSFLEETTRYSAFWSYVSGFCGFNYFGTTSAVNVALVAGDTVSPVSSPSVVDNTTASPTESLTVVTNKTEDGFTAVDSNTSTTTATIITTADAATTNASVGGVASGNSTTDAEINIGSTNSGFTTRYSFNIRTIVTLMAVLLATLIVPGREGWAHGLWGAGKFFVAAVAVTALFSRSDKNGNARRTAKEASRLYHARRLQATCTYNVEILYDGCTKNVQVNAPAARVINVVMEDYTSETNAEDECQTDYTANLTFPVSNSTDVDLSSNNTVAAYDYSDWQCMRAIEGRPFVDASGKGIQALPMLTESCVDELNIAWSGEVSVDLSKAMSRNATHRNQVMLGNEWTQRALGEHASIASFSAFSIALMTNHAPSTLVEDSLKAGLDEVRHARTSFEIASRLLGRNVEPSSLPESVLEFGQDLTALALAVAREGCVDETLSAFAAAAEVDAIHKFVEEGVQSVKYSNVDIDVLRWIRDELRTIAKEESNHSALAWRTLKWVCSVDSKACSAVQREVFDASKLEMRFQQRSEGNASLASLMKKAWERIHYAHRMSSSPAVHSICASTVPSSRNEALISTLSELVLQAIVC